jgi:hypothetical protein
VGEERQGEGRHQTLFELATQQHGVVSTRQLDALGYSPSSAAKAAKVGRLRRIHRGVYAVGHGSLTWHGRCMGAVLAARPSVASHFSAAWLWGLLRYRPGTIHLSAPSARRTRRGFVVHFAALPAADRSVVEEIPVTALPRTLLDLAAVLSAPRLERAIDRAEERKQLDVRPIEELLERAGNHPGRGRLRRALAIYRPDPAVIRSRLEGRFLELVREAGLPVPATNYVLGGFELDAYWERERFAVELDVYETHGTHLAFEADRLRQDDLLLIGVEMIRVTGPRLEREPRATIDRVATHLERRRRELG